MAKTTSLRFEQLEMRRLLASVVWDGGGDGTKWYDPLNWERDVLPSNGDMVAISASSTQVVFDGPSLEIAELSLNADLAVLSNALSITGPLIADSSHTVRVRNAGTRLDLSSPSVSQNLNFSAESGSIISISGVTSFSTSVSRTLEAVGVGSVLTFPKLTEFVGPLGIFANAVVKAEAGGSVQLPLLTKASKTTRFVSTGAGSVISVPEMSMFEGAASGGALAPGFDVLDAGKLLAPKLTSISGASIVIDATGVYDTSKISAFKSSTLTLSRLQDLAGITNFDDSGIKVTNNVAASLPNVTRYQGASSREWLSMGVGSVLTLPNLTEFVGPLGIFANAVVKAEAGGNVQLPLLTEASKTTRFVSTGAGSVISVPEMSMFEGAASGGALAPGFDVLDAGKLLAPKLTSISGASIVIDATGVYDTSKISAFKSSTLTLSRLQDLAGITNFDDSGIKVTNNVAVSLTNVTRYQGASSREWLSTGVGSVLTLPNLTEFVGPLGIFANAVVKAEAGGNVQLPLLTKASKTTRFVSTGAGSVISVPEMSTFEGAASGGALAPGFDVLDAGKLLAPKLTNISGASIIIDTTGIYDTSKISTLKSSTLTLSRIQDLAGITNFDDSGIKVTNNVAASLPNVTRYEGASSREWLSTGVGSVLTFPKLTEFVGPLGIFANAVVKAEAGGNVQLPLLTKASKTTRFVSTGAGSVISVPEMSTFEGAASGGALAPGFDVLDAGKLLAPKLTNISGASIIIDTTGIYDTSKISTLKSSTLTLSRIQDLAGITNFDDSGIEVTNNVAASLPNVTRYEGASSREWLSTGAGSLLTFPKLTEFVGPLGIFANAVVKAEAGGNVQLPLLTKASKTTRFVSTGAGSVISVPEMSMFEGAASGGALAPGFDVLDAGKLLAPKLTNISGASIAIQNSATMSSSNLTIESSTTLTGSGTFVGNLTNNGAVAPGDAIGALTINGNYVQTAEGILKLDVGLDNSIVAADRLAVMGTANLNGTIQFVRVGEFTPTAAQSLQVLSAQSRNGQFSTVTGNTFGGGVELQPTYLASSVNVVGVENTPPRILDAILDGVRKITVNFSKAMDQTTFAATDIVLRNPANAVVSVSRPTWTSPNQAAFELTDAILTNGAYQLVLGPDIRDTLGNQLDQDSDKLVGELTDDQFAKTFTLAIGDLFISNLALSALTATPGQTLQATWQTNNTTGSTINSVLTEQVFLSDDAVIGNDRLIGTFNYDTIASVANRSVSFTIPTTGIGSGKNVYLIARVDTTNVIAESNESNNASLLVTPIVVAQQLSFSLPTNEIREDASAPIRAILSRTGDTALPLTVTLVSSASTDLTAPSSIVIPAGQYSVAVELRGVADLKPDGTQVVTVTATATGFQTASASVQVIDVDLAGLTLNIPVTNLLEGASATATITRSVVSITPLVVSLNNSSVSQISAPLTVTIPANLASATFTLTAVDNDKAEAAQNVSLTASATGYANAGDSVIVDDNDLPQLGLALDKLSISEAAGNSAAIGTVRRTQATSETLTVSLQASSTANLLLPSTVTIPANRTTATFSISTIDDSLINGKRDIVLTAFGTYPADGSRITTGSATAQLAVLDNDGPALFVTIEKQFVGEGLSPATMATVRRSGDKVQPLVVNLSSSDVTEATVLVQVTIPANAESISFPIASIDDKVNDGTNSVTITASATDLASGSGTLAVSDQIVADLIVSEVTVPTTAFTDSFVDVGFRITNVGVIEAANTITQRVFLSTDPFLGDDTLIGNYSFTGVLQPTAPLNTFAQSIPVRIPQKATDYWIIVVADANNAVVEGLESNNTRASATPIRVQPAYTATIGTTIEIAPAGTKVPFTGRATLAATNTPAQFVPIDIDINVRGIKRTISAITDSAGNYAVTFTPLPGEAGQYSVAARHPGASNGLVQDSFTLVGMSAEPKTTSAKVIEDSTSAISSVTIQNSSDVPLTGLTAQAIGLPVGVNITFILPTDKTLPGSASIPLQFQFTVGSVDQSSSAKVNIKLRSAEGATLEILVNLTLVNKAPSLIAVSGQLKAGMMVGAQSIYRFEIKNEGGDASGPIEVRLPAIEWISTATATLPSLAPGESTFVTLLLNPSASLPLTEYRGWLVLASSSTNVAQRVDFAFRAVTEATGDLIFTATDEYTYNAEGSPKVAGATVTISDPFTGDLVRMGVTDSTGIIRVERLPAGYYEVTARAENHRQFSTTIQVEIGTETPVEAFMQGEFVSYTFTVTPTEIQDKTTITVESTFETNVPAPVVVATPGVIDLTHLTQAGDIFQIDLQVTNQGLVELQNFIIALPTHPAFKIESLVTTVPILSAKASLSIPVVFTRLIDKYSTDSPTNASSQDSVPVLAEMEAPIADLRTVRVKGLDPRQQLILTPEATQIVRLEENERVWRSFFEPGALFDYGQQTRDLYGRYFDGTPPCEEFCQNPNLPLNQYNDEDEIIEGAEPLGAWGFRDSPNTIEFNLRLAAKTKQRILDLTTPDGVLTTVTTKETIRFCDLPDSGKDVPILDVLSEDEVTKLLRRFERYTPGVDGIPGAIAAGNGSSDFFSDYRQVSASVKLLPKQRVVLDQCNTGVEIEMQLFISWEVFDTVDFLPGNIFFAGIPIFSQLAELERYGQTFDASFVARWNHKPLVQSLGQFKCKSENCEPCNGLIGLGGYYPCGPFLLSSGASILVRFSEDCPIPTKLSEASSGVGVGAVWFATPAVEAFCSNLIASSTDGTESLVGAAESGVCARVRLQVNQDLVMTRSAFDATLEINNRTTASTVENVDVDLIVTDMKGNDVSELFGAQAPTLSGIANVDGSGNVAPNSTGRATWNIIPSENAAPMAATQYQIGGTLRYRENGLLVTIALAPATITVLPQADLKIHYFHQRDVLSDDPFTDVVEPSQPYSLAVLINNSGFGDAKDVSIISAQPKIIENEKGLLIDFQIIATEVQGQNLSPTLTANFGTIEANSIAQARWLLTSTLQGQFIDYKATFEHEDELGGKRLSLIDSVDIHEMIHLVTAVGAFDDQKFDYLVNDIPDEKDLPDTLWLSDGSVHTVNLATNLVADSPVTAADLQVALTSTIFGGWNYFALPDPGGSKYRVTRIVRSDGVEVPIGDNVSGGNAWQTDRTFIANGKRPIPENKLHFLDFGGDGKYTLTYTPIDTDGPGIESVTGPSALVTTAVDILTVKFDEPITSTSFTRDDLRLTRDGGSTNLITSAVNITRIDDLTYQIAGLAALDSNDGVYTLSLDASLVNDAIGNAGTGLGSVQWIKAASSLAITDLVTGPKLRTTPLTSFTVDFSTAIDPASFTVADIELKFNGSIASLNSSSVTITPVSPTSYQVQGIGASTEGDGDYSLTVRATGIKNTNAATGIGSGTVSWKKDGTAPQLVRVVGLPLGSTRFPVVGDVELVLSEPIDFATISAQDISILRGNNAIDTATLSFKQTAPDRVRVSGLTSLSTDAGAYSFTVNMPGILDLAGNIGLATPALTWTVDTTAPPAAKNLVFTRTSGLQGTLSGAIDETGLVVEVFDLTTKETLADLRSASSTFMTQLTLSAPGNHQLQVRTLDAAGNAVTSVLNVFIDDAPPTVSRVEGIPINSPATLPNEVTVVFTEAVDPASVSMSLFKIRRNEGLSVIPGTAQLTRVNGTTYKLSGIRDVISLDGDYELIVDTSTIKDLAGNLGNGESVTTWQRSTQGPSQTTVRGRVFDDRNKNKTQDPGEAARVGWTVFIDDDRNGTLDLGERSTKTDISGDYAFEGLLPGTYAIGQVIPARWNQTFPNISPVADVDSDGSFFTTIDSFESFASNSTESKSGFFTGEGVGYRWNDQDLTTPDIVDVFYDFRSINGYENTIDAAGISLVMRAFADWKSASNGKVNFVRNTLASRESVIVIGLGDLAALGGVSGSRGTLALGGGDFNQSGAQRVITGGTAWLDFAETWDYLHGNGDITGTFDFYTVITHEIGHAMGLGHTDTFTGSNIMDGIYEGEKTEFSVIDQRLILELYNGAVSVPNTLTFESHLLASSDTVGVHIVTLSGEVEIANLDFGTRFIGQNPAIREDVNGNGVVSPLDALLIINAFNVYGVGAIEDIGLNDSFFYDVSDDATVSPLDILIVFNFLNRTTSAVVQSLPSAEVAAEIYLDSMTSDRSQCAPSSSSDTTFSALSAEATSLIMDSLGSSSQHDLLLAYTTPKDVPVSTGNTPTDFNLVKWNSRSGISHVKKNKSNAVDNLKTTSDVVDLAFCDLDWIDCEMAAGTSD